MLFRSPDGLLGSVKLAMAESEPAASVAAKIVRKFILRVEIYVA